MVLILSDHNLAKRNNIDWPIHLKSGQKSWECYNRHMLPAFEALEQLFKNCRCGGRYKFMAAAGCPKCNEYIFGEDYEDKPVIQQTQGYVFVTVGSVTDEDQRKDNVK